MQSPAEFASQILNTQHRIVGNLHRFQSVFDGLENITGRSRTSSVVQMRPGWVRVWGPAFSESVFSGRGNAAKLGQLFCSKDLVTHRIMVDQTCIRLVEGVYLLHPFNSLRS